MASAKKSNFFDSEEGTVTLQALQSMADDVSYNTEPSYIASNKIYTDNLIPFVDKHMNYLISHPSTNPEHYVSNLRLITRVR